VPKLCFFMKLWHNITLIYLFSDYYMIANFIITMMKDNEKLCILALISIELSLYVIYT
jgi:hypothetical protein